MQTKKILIGALAVVLLAGGAFAYSKSDTLQGKFSSLKTLSGKDKTSEISDILSVQSLDRTAVIIDLSNQDFEAGPSTFVLGELGMNFKAGYESCDTSQGLMLYLTRSETVDNNLLKDTFSDVRLIVKDSANPSWSEEISPTSSSLSIFDLTGLDLTGSTYSVEIEADMDGNPYAWNTSFDFYLSSICAHTTGSNYYWYSSGSGDTGDTSKFNITMTNANGFKIKTFGIVD